MFKHGTFLIIIVLPYNYLIVCILTLYTFILLNFFLVSTKTSIGQSKKEEENFIQANLRIITRETVFQKALRTVSSIRGQSTVIYVLETKGYTSKDIMTVYTIHICMYKARVGHYDPLQD